MKGSRFKRMFYFFLLACCLPLLSACSAIRDWVNRNNEPPASGITMSDNTPQRIMTYQEALDSAVTCLTMILSNEEANTGVLPLLRSDGSALCNDILLRLLKDHTCISNADTRTPAYILSGKTDIQDPQRDPAVRHTVLVLKNPKHDPIFQFQMTYRGGTR